MEIESRASVLQDLRIQSFDTIRFASYRTACKLRYVQKATNCIPKVYDFMTKVLLTSFFQCTSWTSGMSSRRFEKTVSTHSSRQTKSAWHDSKLSSPRSITISTNVFQQTNKSQSIPKPACFLIGYCPPTPATTRASASSPSKSHSQLCAPANWSIN